VIFKNDGHVDDNVVVYGNVDEDVHGCNNDDEMMLFIVVSDHQVNLVIYRN
jgi:hypothetical protein